MFTLLYSITNIILAQKRKKNINVRYSVKHESSLFATDFRKYKLNIN
jgi:hypothetical protein